MNWPIGLRKTLRALLTAVLVIAAIVAIAQLWDHYMHDPWTRDGRVRADVVNLGTDVAGLVDSLEVHDNQLVEKGDVLFTIDQQRYRLALDDAKASLNQLEQERDEAQAANGRRQRLKNYVSQEDKDNARFALNTAQAAVEQAKVEVNQAKLDLERATVRAPVDGYVTNLLLRPGQYVTVGTDAMTLVDAHSFYVLGYFEETKLDSIDVGAPVRVQLLSSEKAIWGHVDSFARGISDSSLSSQENGLASVNASFDWVRLSQRIPVRIALDDIPEGTKLSAGLTATVYLDSDRQGREEAPDWWKPIRQWWEGLISI
ncbi:efflux RND transporter periplasmic adaptor subunit [Salinicola corii]|uniref:Efflux RND transporter periplasmic adaptor subunit n=1 Tax=Salinicola corii TaxID=2606937 RepID=A0A640WDT0_9GAMM|nr:efflux RND transporter periplasmic adaptor subunit [Salinicola corii]KAA0018133.1 efflux RND transporter periplasmic adaptor subunit [Salinicola corii]